MTFSRSGHITEPLEADDANKKHSDKSTRQFGIIYAAVISRKDSSYDENIGNNQ